MRSDRDLERIKLYPGNHADKQAARLFLYKHALAAPIQGHAVTLAGKDPLPEVGLMRDYLKWPAHRAWFVDNSKHPDIQTALTKIKRSWPNARAEAEDLRSLVPRLGALGFANLDLMGAPLQAETLECLNTVSPRLLSGAIMGFTWMRGREDLKTHPAAKLLWALGKGYRGNERRWAGMLNAVDQISKGSLIMIDRYEYLSNHSPMSVAVFKKK